MTAAKTCFHCALPVPADCALTVDIGDEAQPVCCPGCQAVAETISGSGLEAYYAHREVAADRATEELADLAVFDDPELQRDFVSSEGDASVATLSVEGMRCAACAWLIERHLTGLAGVHAADVALATQRVLVRFDPARVRVSDLLGALQLNFGNDQPLQELLLEGQACLDARIRAPREE